MFIYRQFGNNNPGGIEINLGYYALLECILKGTYTSIALARWCDLKQDANLKRRYKGKVVLDVDKLQQIFKDRFLTYAYLSEITGKSRTFFIRMLGGKHKNYPPEIVAALEEGLGLEEGSLLVKEDE